MAAINWDLPLETDEATPRAVTWASVRATGREPTNSFAGRIVDTGETGIWNDQGIPVTGDQSLPRIRNVRAIGTSRDEAFRRMEDLVRKLDSCPGNEACLVEAREIVKLLPAPPVDPLLIEARRIAQDTTERVFPDFMAGAHDGELPVRCALAGLQRGQELAHGEYAADKEVPGTFYRSIDRPVRPEPHTPGMRDLLLMLIERPTSGGPHRYRCDPIIREMAESVALTLGMNP